MSATLGEYYRRRQMLIDRLGGVCVDCGTDRNLEFDHVDPAQKEFDVSSNWSINLEDLLSEIDKCVLRCKPCHEIKTRFVDGISSKHGTLSMSKHHKCKCDLCRNAYNAYMREYKHKRKSLLVQR